VREAAAQKVKRAIVFAHAEVEQTCGRQRQRSQQRTAASHPLPHLITQNYNPKIFPNIVNFGRKQTKIGTN
jgi:hypothetical protein